MIAHVDPIPSMLTNSMPVYPTAILVSLFALTSAPVGAASLHRCTDADGRVAFQDQPCPPGSTQQTREWVRDPAAAAAATNDDVAVNGPDANDSSQDQLILSLVSIQTGYELCTRSATDFDERHAALFEKWRLANAAAFQRVERSQRYRMILANGRRQASEQAALMTQVPTQFASFCEAQFMPQIERLVGDAP